MAAQGLQASENAYANFPGGQCLPGRQGGLQPIPPTLLRRNPSGQGGKFEVGVAIDEPRQDGPGAVVADQSPAFRP